MTTLTNVTSRARTWTTTTLVVLAGFVILAFVPPASACDGCVGAAGATTSVVRFTYDGWREIEESDGALGTGIAAEVTKSPFVAGFSPFHQAKAAWTGRENFTGRELSTQERLMCGLDAALSILGPLGKLAQGGSAVLKFAGYARQFDAGLKAIQGGLQIAELVQTGVEMAAGVTASIGEEFESIAEAMAVPDEGMDNCFLRGTLVIAGGVSPANSRSLVKTWKPIEQVTSSDQVWSRDARTGEYGWQHVVRTFHNVTEQVVHLTVGRLERGRESRSSGCRGDEGAAEPPSLQTIRCTPTHPFFAVGRGLTFAGQLEPGDLVQGDGAVLHVVAVEVREERAETFNFEVGNWHTYFVAEREGSGGLGSQREPDSPATTLEVPSRVFEAKRRGSSRDVIDHRQDAEVAKSLLASFASLAVPTAGQRSDLTGKLSSRRG